MGLFFGVVALIVYICLDKTEEKKEEEIKKEVALRKKYEMMDNG